MRFMSGVGSIAAAAAVVAGIIQTRPAPKTAAKRFKEKSAKGEGVARARIRLAAHRKAQAERLKHASWPDMSRQEFRAIQRTKRKALTMTPAQAASVRIKDELPKYPRTTFVHGI